MLIEHVYSSGATRQFPINISGLVSSWEFEYSQFLSVTARTMCFRFAAGGSALFCTGGVSKLSRQFANSFVLIAQMTIAPRT